MSYEEARRKAIEHGALQPQDMGERISAGLMMHEHGVPFSSSARAQSRLDQWTEDLMTGKELPADRNCFIATELYGSDSLETCTLRAWRDSHLNVHWLGRRVVQLYYRSSPFIVRLMQRRASARLFIGVVVGKIVHLVAPNTIHGTTRKPRNDSN
jgi:hypothetical protein